MSQSVLPGTSEIIGSYQCGHGRTHQIPSEDVRLLKSGGAGFVSVCSCGDRQLSEVTEKPLQCGPHRILLGGESLEPELWLMLEHLAGSWACEGNGKQGTLGGGLNYAARRVRRRDEYREIIQEEKR